MPANYLIRMDDACPTMHSDRWARLEEILDAHDILPVVAVVPDNKDPELIIESPDPAFWEKVRNWQAKGWTIAMHGETHLMRPTDAEQVLPFYKRSEFSGLTLEMQSEKLRRAQFVFDREGISVETWIAPAHCFDWVTLAALRACTTIKTISDSIAVNVYFNQGLYWVPQQLWGFRDIPFGLWTICLHPNRMDDEAFQRFERDIQTYSDRIMNFSDVELVKRPRGFIDRLVNALYWMRRHQYRAGLR
jgi:hypothetical protein